MAANEQQRTHDLKLWPEYFGPARDGLKNFEYRKNDRDYRVGDILRLREWSPITMVYTGAEILRRVTMVLEGFGLPEGHCIMSMKPIGDGKHVFLTTEEIDAINYEIQGAFDYEKPIDDALLDEVEKVENDDMRARIEALERVSKKLNEE